MTIEVIPQQLQSLFTEMSFIASAKPGVKLCFKNKRHVDANSWFSIIYRTWYNESQGGRGNDIIRKCCEEAVQTYKQYKDTIFADLILDRMIKMRDGIVIIKTTYENDETKISVCSHLDISITILHMILPVHPLVKIAFPSTELP